MALLAHEKMLTLTRLSCLAKSLEGKYTIIDLRNDSSVNGKIINVDGWMNISMEDVIFTNPNGEEFYCDNFFIRERNVRYIHIPNEVNVMETIVNTVNKIKGLKKPKFPMSLKQSKLMLRQIETKKLVAKIVKEKQRMKAEAAAAAALKKLQESDDSS